MMPERGLPLKGTCRRHATIVMLSHMKRTTLQLEPALYQGLRRRAAGEGRTLTDVVEQVLRAGLARARDREAHSREPALPYDLGPALLDAARPRRGYSAGGRGMIAVDSGVLVAAANRFAPEHARAPGCWSRSRTAEQPWALPWSARARVPARSSPTRTRWRVRWSPPRRGAFLEALRRSPTLRLLGPTERHAAVCAEVLESREPGSTGLPGSFLTAVLLREHGVRELLSPDLDMRRWRFLGCATRCTARVGRQATAPARRYRRLSRSGVRGWRRRVYAARPCSGGAMPDDPRLARTPEPPYWVVMFTSRRTSQDDEGYGRMAEAMAALAASQPGYLGLGAHATRRASASRSPTGPASRRSTTGSVSPRMPRPAVGPRALV